MVLIILIKVTILIIMTIVDNIKIIINKIKYHNFLKYS